MNGEHKEQFFDQHDFETTATEIKERKDQELERLSHHARNAVETLVDTGRTLAEKIAESHGIGIEEGTQEALEAIREDAQTAYETFVAETSEENLDSDIDLLNAIFSAHRKEIEAGKNVHEWDMSEEERERIIAAGERVQMSMNQKETAHTILLQIDSKFFRDDMAWLSAEAQAKQDPNEAWQFIVDLYQQLGEEIPAEFKQRREFLTSVYEREKSARDRETIKQFLERGGIDALVSASETYLSNPLAQTEFDWRAVETQIIESIKTTVLELSKNDIKSGVEAYRRFPDHTRLMLPTRIDLYQEVERILPLSERIEFVQEEFAIASRENRKRFLDEMATTFEDETVRDLLNEIEDSRFTGINVNTGTVENILEDGRLKSSWEVGNRDFWSHDSWRNSHESVLGTRSHGTPESPHPIYGSVRHGAGKRGQGDASSFGDITLKIREDVVKERAVFLYGDLSDRDLGEFRGRQFSYEDVAIAQARVVLEKKATYVEAQILGGVKLQDIEAIVIPQNIADSQPQYIESLRAKLPEGLEIQIV